MTMTKAFLLSGSALFSAGLFMSFPSAAMAQEATFVLTEHEEAGRRTPLIRDWKDLTSQVSEFQSLLGSLKASPFFGAFSDTVAQYQSKLTLLDDVLAKLNPIQRKWVYLEPIFGSEDIMRQLPMEAKRFNEVIIAEPIFKI